MYEAVHIHAIFACIIVLIQQTSTNVVCGLFSIQQMARLANKSTSKQLDFKLLKMSFIGHVLL